jgi:hypothetical protein
MSETEPPSSTTYSLKEINPSANAWDEIIPRYRTAMLFHESVWLEHLERTQGGKRILVMVGDHDRELGYFCGVVVRKGPFRVLGSPLRGWWTPMMGPIIDDFQVDKFLFALDGFCRDRNIQYVELCSPIFQASLMESAGYVADKYKTHIMQILPADKMWSRMATSARGHIRQAEKKGVSIEVAENISVMDEYYAQLKAVFARRSLTPPHSREIVMDLWNSLKPIDRFVVLRAMHEGKSVATFVGAFDEHTLYSLGWASWPESYPLRPNDLMQWKVMNFAAERGLQFYDMCGGGDFGVKFGTEVIQRIRWRRTLTHSARISYYLYRNYWFGRRQLMHHLREIVHRHTQSKKP